MSDDTIPDAPKETTTEYDLGEWYLGFRAGQSAERHDWLEAASARPST